MSSSITLSSATRQNLLSLQDTANLLSTTQNRLSTGKKVNSALDSPTNFFTSQALTARSGDLSGLLDGISNGIQVIQAANQGITSIQKLLDTAKSTAQQAIADKSGAAGTFINGKGAQGAAVTAGTSYKALPGNADGVTKDFSSLDKDGSIDISLDGGTTKTTLRLDALTLKSFTNDLKNVTGEQVVSAINSQIAGTTSLAGKVSASLTPDGRLSFNTVGTGADQKISVAGSAGSSIDIGYGKATSPAAAVVTAGTDAVLTGYTAANGASLTVNDGNTSVDVTVLSTSLKADGSALGGTPTIDDLVDAINVQLKAGGSSITAGKDGAGTKLTFTTEDQGPSATVSVIGKDVPAAGTELQIGFGTAAANYAAAAKAATGSGNAATAVVAAGIDATDGSSKAKIAGSAQAGPFSFAAAGANASFSLQLGTGPTKTIKLDTTTGLGAAGKTQADVLKSINDQIAADTGLKGKVAVAFVNDKLTFTSTAYGSDQKISVQALSTSTVDIGLGSGNTATALTGSGTDVGGSSGVSSTRTTLAKQFNDLLVQITQQARDASYNGVNLLYRNGTDAKENTLHVTFNENGTSALDISGVKFDADGLGLKSATANFATDDEVNNAIASLTTATYQLRAQSSTFGANLSVVQNRQDFSKNLINILDTGSSNLTSADLNEEAANSQALSTRNSLAISALSLANQAQQGILQLLR